MGVDRDSRFNAEAEAETANWKRRNAVDEIVEINHVAWVTLH